MLKGMSNKLRCLLLPLVATATGHRMTGFIVGGTRASIRDWPFIAFVFIYKDGNKVASCGGSLISSQTVLTAGHCLDDIVIKNKNLGKIDYAIFMGHARLTEATMRRTVIDYTSHEKYQPEETDYDIGMLFLSSPVEFQRNVEKVLLMTKSMARNMFKEGEYVVAGWGKTKVNGRSSEVLNELDQPLIDTKECNSYISYYDDPGIICGGKVNDSDFAYSGDSGGPLARKKDHYLAGIVSWRLESYGLTVYTSVPYYYGWIERTQKSLFKKNCPNRDKDHSQTGNTTL